jgi:hypothetical protein
MLRPSLRVVDREVARQLLEARELKQGSDATSLLVITEYDRLSQNLSAALVAGRWMWPGVEAGEPRSLAAG